MSHTNPPPPFVLHRGVSPVLVSMPHIGSYIPSDQLARMAPQAAVSEDTDWHLDKLYAFAADLGATVLQATHSRYVVDLNRPPENLPMYPGKNNTELCPTHHFSGEPLYLPGQNPSDEEVQRRIAQHWRPYHDTLRAELHRILEQHGYALLFDAHSIKSELPWLFDGRLPDLNLGTVDGTSCSPALRAALAEVFAAQQRFTHVVDGRFKGGHITRHYGQPSQGVHAVQLEMCWSCYMREEPPYAWDAELAAGVQPLLKQLLTTMRDWKPA